MESKMVPMPPVDDPCPEQPLADHLYPPQQLTQHPNPPMQPADQRYPAPADQPHPAPAGQPYPPPAGQPYPAPAGQPHLAPAGQPYPAPAGQPYPPPGHIPGQYPGYQTPVITQQPAAYQQASSNTVVVNQQVVEAQKNARDWSSGLCDFCQDCDSFCKGLCCPSVLLLEVSDRMGEGCCLPCCFPQTALFGLRASLRAQENIEFASETTPKLLNQQGRI